MVSLLKFSAAIFMQFMEFGAGVFRVSDVKKLGLLLVLGCWMKLPLVRFKAWFSCVGKKSCGLHRNLEPRLEACVHKLIH